ncbi:MAG: dienelactone hydrolase [Acidimicrobiales bacterium]|jgi:hypothetical protein|nr:dienelactone hydrolase [Acidimicrobiales bacterium]
MKPKGIVLFHGAGGNKDHRVLTQIEAVSEIPVLRQNFDYRNIGGRRPPPRIDTLVEEVKRECAVFAEKINASTSSLLVGGRSMGGRAASMAAASGLNIRGLVLLSYPLHPVKKPEKLRVEHFPNIKKPCLFISGDRDPFGSPQTFSKYLKLIESPVTMEWLEGQNHDPKKTDLVIEKLQDWILSLR